WCSVPVTSPMLLLHPSPCYECRSPCRLRPATHPGWQAVPKKPGTSCVGAEKRAGAEAAGGETECAGAWSAWEEREGRELMRVLVIGGTGLISTGIVKALLARGHDVSVFNRGQRKSRLPEGVTYLQGNRRDYPAFEAAMQDVACDAVIDM